MINKKNFKIEHFHNAKIIESKFPEKKFKTDQRLSNLLESISNIDPNGFMFEFGVYSGETINFIAKYFPQKTLYGFDSFEGLPEEWILNEKRTISRDHFNVNGNLPLVNKNVQLIKGWFDNTLPKFIIENNLNYVSYLHIDCDLYSSTKTIFDNLNDYIVPGTVIVFDELYPWKTYKWFTTWEEHEYKALKEWVEKYNRTFKILHRSNHCQVSIKIIS